MANPFMCKHFDNGCRFVAVDEIEPVKAPLCTLKKVYGADICNIDGIPCENCDDFVSKIDAESAVPF